MSMELVPSSTKSPVHDPGGNMASTDVRALAGGQKRQKLSHSPETSHIPGLPSQDSQSSDQSASKWFEDANKNILLRNRERSKVDDDPPFYMSNRTTYIPPNFGASESERIFGNQSRFDSENEDLRGVIDDLTVENKRLRHMVKHHNRHRRGTPSDISQQQDKLFEVRMHGLPPEKRRELEYLLKNFASSVHTTVPSKTSSANTSMSATSSTGQAAGNLKAPLTDSGYASMSNSGQNSGLHVGNQLPARSNTKTVKNYLHDIPNSLLPRHNPIMSERAKMTLVVRRLEQLFTGRKAAPGEHSQPIQQQEVSHSAAKADQIRDVGNNLKRKAEGSREAHIMPPDSKVNLDAMDTQELKHQRMMPKLESEVSNSDMSMLSQPGSPDQRPTRPLDLDIHRAQIAAENIEYIRHLGLSSPHFQPDIQGAEHQWMYLNLLSSMAQLHTLSVTPEFVRRAIKKYSKNFELSRDCQRVRWIGGTEGTKFTAEDEKVLEIAVVSPPELTEDVTSGGSSKRSKTNSTSNAAITTNDTTSEDKTSGLQTSSGSKLQQTTISGISNLRSSNQQSSTNMTKPTTQGSAFDYKPLIYKDGLREEYAESYLRDSDESYDSVSGDSSGLANALSRSNLNKQIREEGPITFFNNAYFCSDFSAETIPSNMQDARPVMIGETLGIFVPDEGAESPLRYHDATYFAMQFAPKPYQPKADHDPKLRMNVPNLEPFASAGEEESYPLEMEVCGLGGVTPDDNFAIDVKTKLVRVPPGKDSRLVRKLPFSGRKYAQRYRYDLNEERKLELMPSKLPPPSYGLFTSSSSSNGPDGDDASEDSDDSSSSVSERFEPPVPPFLMEFSGSSGGGVADDEDEHESSSIDMLALARRADPHQIAEQERVYMINQPGGFGRTVAGSLAATVGESRSPSPEHDAAISSDASHDGSMEAEMEAHQDE